MYVQLTEIVSKAAKLFCNITGVELKAKQVKKIIKALADDDNVQKHYFCEAKCVSSERICMKKVDDEGMCCYIHDPDRKCQGNNISGVKCRSVAKVGETHCRRHLDQAGRHVKRSTKVSTSSEDERPAKKVKRDAKKTKNRHSSVDSDADDSAEDKIRRKKAKKPRTPEHVDADVDDSSEDDTPRMKSKVKESRHSHTLEDTNSEEEEDENVSDRESSYGALPLSSKVFDITSKKKVPSAKKGKWVKCPFNDNLEYARNFTVNGKHILKLRKKDAYHHLYTAKNLSADDTVFQDLTSKESRILEKMGLRQTTKAENQKIFPDESDEESDDKEASEDKESDGSNESSEEAEAEKLVKGNKKPKPTSICKGFTKPGAKCTKPVAKGEYCTLHHTQASNHVSKKNVTWETFPLADNLEYTYDICIRGRYPLKKRKEDLVVKLVTKEQLSRPDEWYMGTMTLQDKEELFIMGLVPEEYKPCPQQKQADNIADNCLDEEQSDSYDSKYDDDSAFLISSLHKNSPIADTCLDDEQSDSYDSKYDDDSAFLIRTMQKYVVRKLLVKPGKKPSITPPLETINEDPPLVRRKVTLEADDEP